MTATSAFWLVTCVYGDVFLRSLGQVKGFEGPKTFTPYMTENANVGVSSQGSLNGTF